MVILIVGVVSAVFMKSRNGQSEADITNEIILGVFNKENINIYEKNIETNKEFLSEVLIDIEELNLVIEDSQYGAYITSVMGIEQGDNYYWSYYIDGEYATTGISTCKIEDGKKYEFRIEKFEVQ